MEKVILELPCEIGQEIYFIDNYVKSRWEIFKGKILYFKYSQYTPRKESELSVCIEIKNKYHTQSPNNTKLLKIGYIGERIFFTEEEANKQLYKFLEETKYLV